MMQPYNPYLSVKNNTSKIVKAALRMDILKKGSSLNDLKAIALQ